MICHRDIKCGNVYATKNLKRVKIIDFNAAIRIKEGHKMYGAIGEPHLSAPEIYDGGFYSENVDIWSVGMIAYQLM